MKDREIRRYHGQPYILWMMSCRNEADCLETSPLQTALDIGCASQLPVIPCLFITKPIPLGQMRAKSAVNEGIVKNNEIRG